MTHAPMSAATFAILSGLIEQRSGMHYGEAEKELLADKIQGPMLDAGFESYLDYYYYLRYDPEGGAALDALVEALLVHETYFGRELEPLRVAIEEVILPRVREGKRPRIWCAACATGEEALSIAMLLASHDVLGQCELVASDLSASALERARRGAHGRRAIRDALPDAFAPYLRVTDERVESDPCLRGKIDWRRVNLVDAAEVATVGECDLVVCRNVLIYFADPVAVRVVSSLADALAPGGRLLVGVSESLLRLGTRLRCEERRCVFLYASAEDAR